MPQFTFEDPSGKQHTIEGPEGSTREEAFQHLQTHLGGSQPAPSGGDDYRGKLTSAMDAAMKALMPSWNHNNQSYSPYKPAQPGNMPNDAINPVGNDAQMATALGAAGAAGMAPRIAAAAGGMRGPPGGPGAPQAPINMSKLPTQQAIQNNRGLGGPAPPSSPIGGNPGEVAQNQLLSQMVKEGASMIGHAVGGPFMGAAARFAPKILGMK